ncbi:hypothetical protein AGLY_000423 [Aphis glycines]|uniref:Uncharacterized protein n=1 Tax=Aphis glycines TaxID=307491 RepID=A0A6G0U7Y4_APHGL|nr:hypothetical protein AGLY_000423 [Aphis glycines]
MFLSSFWDSDKFCDNMMIIIKILLKQNCRPQTNSKCLECILVKLSFSISSIKSLFVFPNSLSSFIAAFKYLYVSSEVVDKSLSLNAFTFALSPINFVPINFVEQELSRDLSVETKQSIVFWSSLFITFKFELSLVSGSSTSSSITVSLPSTITILRIVFLVITVVKMSLYLCDYPAGLFYYRNFHYLKSKLCGSSTTSSTTFSFPSISTVRLIIFLVIVFVINLWSTGRSLIDVCTPSVPITLSGISSLLGSSIVSSTTDSFPSTITFRLTILRIFVVVTLSLVFFTLSLSTERRKIFSISSGSIIFSTISSPFLMVFLVILLTGAPASGSSIISSTSHSIPSMVMMRLITFLDFHVVAVPAYRFQKYQIPHNFEARLIYLLLRAFSNVRPLRDIQVQNCHQLLFFRPILALLYHPCLSIFYSSWMMKFLDLYAIYLRMTVN